ERGLHVRGKPCALVTRDTDVEVVGRTQLLAVALQRREQAEVVESGGTEPAREASHVAHSLCRQLAQAVPLRLCPVHRAGVLEILQPQENRGQGLAGLIVQLAGDARALFLLRRY